MTYSITKTDGTIIKELEENVIEFDVVSNIGLIGKLSPNYGETQSNNFVHLAENFANNVEPDKPLTGMVYFNTDDQSLYICTDSSQKNWDKLLSIKYDMSDNPKNGDMYYNQELKQLFIFDESIEPLGEWVLIGPDNYTNKKKYNTVLETGKELSETYYEIPFESNTSNLVTIKIVANEKISNESVNYGVKEPECSAWIYKLLVNSYATTVGNLVKIVGSPTYELIGKSNNDFNIKLSIKDNRLNIGVNGTVSDNLSKVLWEMDIEVIKV